MNGLAYAQQVLDECAPLLPEVKSWERVGDASWIILFHDETLLEVVYVEASDKLYVLTDLGAPCEENKPRVHEMLLTSNYLQRETEGLVMALDARGRVVQTVSFVLHGLTVVDMVNLFANFARRGRLWTELIQANPTDADPAEAIPPLSHAIRV